MAKRTAVLRSAPAQALALLAALALLLGAPAPAVPAPASAPDSSAPAAPRTAGAHTADGPCAAECDRVPLLHRGAAAERNAPHPAGASLPRRIRPAGPTPGIRPPAPLPHSADLPPYTARHPGRAPPPPPGS
ncbi:hypothetical protein IQ279_12325 [Streptomyces verrucosisporus]|uniref:hypothetical protein n=1 Tax=Streptomyces verrucosisporus TaxID=1695161 RepID=UPI0019D13D7F|nr:hypothetical protein [Streptomyces verrucosisporus]MBN3930410.1 hypothetical protein [Streptomyces verrucosisporus]